MKNKQCTALSIYTRAPKPAINQIPHHSYHPMLPCLTTCNSHLTMTTPNSQLSIDDVLQQVRKELDTLHSRLLAQETATETQRLQYEKERFAREKAEAGLAEWEALARKHGRHGVEELSTLVEGWKVLADVSKTQEEWQKSRAESAERVLRILGGERLSRAMGETGREGPM